MKLFLYRILSASLFLAVLFACKNNEKQNILSDQKNIEETTKKPKFALVLHGGAGSIKKEYFNAEQEKIYKDKLREALYVGYAVLEQGGNAQEAVQKTINVLENSPLFNAGKGAVLNSLGKVEMDASIMDGKTLNCGSVAGVSHIKNPISAARVVMDSTRHVFLAGEGAEIFVKQKGIILEKEDYFIIPKRVEQLKRIQEREKGKKVVFSSPLDLMNDHKYGTVGCVALDQNGNIAAGTSTGGLMNKKFGRIGDSPIIGAGTYADNFTCGVSCTGTGEYFIRTLAAHSVSDLLRYKNTDLKIALKNVLNRIKKLGGDGGMIALDKDGNIAWHFNTDGMFRAYKKFTGEEKLELYKN